MVAVSALTYGLERVLRETTADQVMISEFVYGRLAPSQTSSFAEKGVFTLKGKADPVRLFCCDAKSVASHC